MTPDRTTSPAFKVAAFLALAAALATTATRAKADTIPTIGRPACTETGAPTMTGSASAPALSPLTACSGPNPSASHPAAAEPRPLVPTYGTTAHGGTVYRSADGRFAASTTRTSHDETTRIELRHAKDGSPYFFQSTTTRRH